MTMPFKVVEVHWLDAWVDTDEISVTQARKKKPVLTITIGQLIAENNDGLVMVVDTYPKSKNKGRVPNFIPWGIIEEYYEFEDV